LNGGEKVVEKKGPSTGKCIKVTIVRKDSQYLSQLVNDVG
jgi:hypothetical protein